MVKLEVPQIELWLGSLNKLFFLIRKKAKKSEPFPLPSRKQQEDQEGEG